MKIVEIMKKKKPTISFEVFPPNQVYTLEQVFQVIDELALLEPDFMSVTYGAGGSTRGNTVQIASRIKNKNKIESLAHLTCIGATASEIEGLLNELKREGIENVMALRGDRPQDKTETVGDFHHASDLVHYIKHHHDFAIGGAFYPEGHKETNELLDLFHLKEKVQAGADFLISQIFFDNDQFFRFQEQLQKLEITVPIIAGVMPITNAKQIRRITSLCGCTIPLKLKRILDRYEDKEQAMKEAGVAYAMEQIVELISADIDGIHLYTMNRIEAARTIMATIGAIMQERGQ